MNDGLWAVKHKSAAAFVWRIKFTHLVDKRRQLPEVGSAPIYLLAICADLEISVVALSFGLKPVQDLLFGYRLQGAVAAQTTAPGLDLRGKLVAMENIRYLLAWVFAAQAVTMDDLAALEQAPVAA